MQKTVFQIITAILIQLVITPFLLFMLFGFFASFEYHYINYGHITYGLLYLLLSYFFILAAKQRWHRLISILLIIILTTLALLKMLAILKHW